MAGTGSIGGAVVTAAPPKQDADPLASWANDDLLLDASAQQMLAATSPRAFRVLDWATLREAFETHNRAADRAKRTVNRHGMTGALLSAAGASLLALAPLLQGGTAQGATALAGCGIVLSGGIMGLWHLVGHKGRAQWLLARLWTERLRQFYFQHTVNNLDAAVVAMGDDTRARGLPVRAGRRTPDIFRGDPAKCLRARFFPVAYVGWRTTTAMLTPGGSACGKRT